MYVLVSGTYHLVVSRNLCQKSWNADNSRDSTVIIPLYVVPHMWAYSATISTSLDRFFLNCSQPAVAFFLSASVKGLTRYKIRNANITEPHLGSRLSNPSVNLVFALREIDSE